MLRRMQERHGTGSIPVIMFSGQAESSDDDAQARGAQGFLGKPFNPQDLITRTKNSCARRARPTPLKLVTGRRRSQRRPRSTRSRSRCPARGLEVVRDRDHADEDEIVASEPRTITTRLSGTGAGSSMPAAWSRCSARMASPSSRTIFASAPVCQPITATVRSPELFTYTSHQGRKREHHPAEPGQPLAGPTPRPRPARSDRRSPPARTPPADRSRATPRREVSAMRRSEAEQLLDLPPGDE